MDPYLNTWWKETIRRNCKHGRWLTQMLSSWILNVIKPNLPTSVAYTNIAKSMWDTLKRRYTMANALKMHHLKTNLANCKQGGWSVVEFYSKISELGIELENHGLQPHCSCSGCKCELGEVCPEIWEGEDPSIPHVSQRWSIFINKKLDSDPRPIAVFGSNLQYGGPRRKP